MRPDEERPGPPTPGDRANTEGDAANAPADVVSTVAGGADTGAELRRRRAASYRLPRLASGARDPLDELAGTEPRATIYRTYNVSDLGLDCDHGPGCRGRGWAA